MSKHRVAVIGGGIFGVSCALELAGRYEVDLFERNPSLLRGATFANHNRHHYGFHYPRSPETAEQCLASRESFEGVYGDCLVWDFDNFYGVAADQTKTTPEQFLAFCDRAGLVYEEAWPEEGVLDREKVALCLKVREGVYDWEVLERLVAERVAGCTGLRVHSRTKVLGGRVEPSGAKTLEFEGPDGAGRREYDFVINATYANSNRFCEWFGFPRRQFQFNLQELSVVQLPVGRRLSVTIMDGPFPSFLPWGRSPNYLLAHVNASQLIRDTSAATSPLLGSVNYVLSNWEGVREVCSEYIPLIRRADYRRSIFVDRVVDASRLHDDARLSDLTPHGSGCWSVFSAKVITSITTARKLRGLVEEEA